MSEVYEAAPPAEGWVALMPLFRELNDLKRIRTPEITPSVAAAAFSIYARRLFADDGDWLQAGFEATAQAVVATRLGGIRDADLKQSGLSAADRNVVFARALAVHAEALDTKLYAELGQASRIDLVTPDPTRRDWIARLNAQPRAGATAPDQPRWVLEPVESCGEHCQLTAVYGVLLAPYFGADPGAAFAIGLAHHLHNAYLPDAGFAGEMLLGSQLETVIANLRETGLAEIVAPAAERVRPLLAEIANADTPLARTFHTADTVDRVLQMEYFARMNTFSLETALVDMDIVHAGPVQDFQKARLAAAGLLA